MRQKIFVKKFPFAVLLALIFAILFRSCMFLWKSSAVLPPKREQPLSKPQFKNPQPYFSSVRQSINQSKHSIKINCPSKCKPLERVSRNDFERIWRKDFLPGPNKDELMKTLCSFYSVTKHSKLILKGIPLEFAKNQIIKNRIRIKEDDNCNLTFPFTLQTSKYEWRNGKTDLIISFHSLELDNYHLGYKNILPLVDFDFSVEFKKYRNYLGKNKQFCLSDKNDKNILENSVDYCKFGSGNEEMSDFVLASAARWLNFILKGYKSAIAGNDPVEDRFIKVCEKYFPD